MLKLLGLRGQLSYAGQRLIAAVAATVTVARRHRLG
jgi:hypothetical protein